MNEASTPAKAAKIAAILAVENGIKHSAQPYKRPELHHTYIDRFPLPERSDFCDPTEKSRKLDEGEVDTKVAIGEHDKREGYFIPENLGLSERELCARIKEKFRALDPSKDNGLDIYIRWREESAPEGKEQEVVALLLVAGGGKKTPKEEMWSKPSKDASKALKNLQFRVNDRGRRGASSANGVGCTRIWQRKLLRLIARKKYS